MKLPMEHTPLPPPPAGYSARVPWIPEAKHLVETGPDYLGRDAWLTAGTAAAWHDMRLAAAADGVEIFLVSAFRSIARQEEILRGKLARGMTLEDALLYSAYPGHSEHHSGEAIDIGTSFSPPLKEEFELTPAFTWLQHHAVLFGFHMSYPREHPSGIAYEPWHWRHHAAGVR